jgi:uncharacterized membrane protein
MGVSRGFSSLSQQSLRLWFISIWGMVCLLILAAPLFHLFSSWSLAFAVKFPFSLICHQIPDRSYSLLNIPLAVCHRCTGIYFGFFAGSFIKRSFPGRAINRRVWVGLALIPMLLEFGSTFIGIWTGTHFSRCVTGFVSGCLLAPLIIQAFHEMLCEQSLKKSFFDACRLLVPGRRQPTEVVHE